MTHLTRRTALAGAGLAGAGLTGATLPRIAIAQADTRPSITVAVQKIATSATLEPLREQSNVGQRILYSFAETMIDIDWTGNLGQTPRLATGWKRIDDRTVELTLREGVKFHNGATLTAEDVAFTFGEARMWTGTAADNRGVFVSTTQGAASKVPPPEAPAIAKAAYPGFERIEITGPRTLRFVNRTPDVTLESRLTRNTGAIFSRQGFDEAASWMDWARKPVGTGPYKIRLYRPDQDLVLDAHDEYWGGRWPAILTSPAICRPIRSPSSMPIPGSRCAAGRSPISGSPCGTSTIRRSPIPACAAPSPTPSIARASSTPSGRAAPAYRAVCNGSSSAICISAIGKPRASTRHSRAAC